MDRSTDILIAGAGAAGLTAAIAFASAGFDVVVCGGLDTRRNARTVALFEASLRFFRSMGLWDQLAPIACPIERIRLIDSTNSMFPTAPTLLRASEIGLEAFGVNIENVDLVGTLAKLARETAGLTLVDDLLSDYILSSRRVSGRLGSGGRIEAALLVGADGRASTVRAAAGIGHRDWTYPQTALTALVWHERPHRRTSTEFHTRIGPCTLVPMNGTETRPNRSSLVWLMSPDEATRRMDLGDDDLAIEIQRQVGDLHGAMGLEGPRGSFPMGGMFCHRLTSTRVALVADAAHYYPPIGAQGLNLGLRDVAQLVSSVAKFGRGDPGAPAGLDDYQAKRRLDVSTRTFGVSTLNSSLLSHTTPVDFLRAAGLAAMANVGPLRRALMWEGVAPAGRLPPAVGGARGPGGHPAGTPGGGKGCGVGGPG